MCRCLRLPFVGPFMPSLGSCDNTGTAALKRYIVEHKAVTHAAVQTLALSGLTDRPPSDEYNSPTLLWAITLGDSIMTSCDVIGTSTFVWCNPRTHTETNTLFFFFFFLTCMKSALRRRGHACSCPLFTSFYNCRLKGHCEPKRIRERGIRVCVNSRTALRRCPPRHNRPLPVHIVSWSFRG